MMRWLLAIWIAVLTAFGAAPGHAAEKNPLFGKWTITNAQIAPWTSETAIPGLTAEGRKYLGMNILFTARMVLSKDRSLRCRNPGYERTSFPADSLFKGGLPEPEQGKLAQSMGFPAGLVPGVDVSCSAGLFSYHLRPDGRVLFAYNNIVYTLTRR